MKVLVADDHEAIRSALKRLLVKQFDCTIIEAADGLEALDAVARYNPTFALIDVDMPYVSGLEVLQSLRASPLHASMPITIISGQNDEATVREMIRLGITDYLAKPLRSERVAARLTRMAEMFAASREQRAAEGQPPLSALNETTPILIADSDPEFRHFFKAHLGTRYPVMEAPKGTDALKMCLTSMPAAVFIGNDTGLMAPEMLTKKLRALRGLAGVPLVAIVPGSALEQTKASGLYDAVVTRTFVPEAFDKQFRELTANATPYKALCQTYPNFPLHVASATEQAFGMLANCEIAQTTSTWTAAGDGVQADVTLAIEGQPLVVHLTIDCDMSSARTICAKMNAVHASTAGRAECEATLGELLTIISCRVQKGLLERDIAATCSVPQTRTGTPKPAEQNADVQLFFGSPDDSVKVAAAITVAATGA
jgi:CheY-like chemotaxis protein